MILEVINELEAKLRVAQLASDVNVLDTLIDESLCLPAVSVDVLVVALRTRLAGSMNGQEFDGDYRYTRVWVRRGDSWRIVAGHVSAA